MADTGNRTSTPPWPWPLSLIGLLAQGFGTFFLPFLVGMVGALFFESAEVIDTGWAMLAFTALVLFPISLAQLLGTLLKSRRDLLYWRERGELTFARTLDVFHTHLSVVTPRGWMVLVTGLAFILFSLSLKWASLGLIAVFSLFLFYMVTGWTIFVSTFLVHSFERGMGNASSGITRQILPAVTQSGEAVEEVMTFHRIPIPWGYVLLVSDPLPVRLKTESRYAIGATARSHTATARGRLRATPRGHYRLGPARIWYQDVLGISRISVASAATAELKCLPRILPVQIIEPPRSRQHTPDILTKPHRFATEDHFRFREYAPGDDTRRIQWRLSMRTGHLQVRLPESREVSTQDVVLVLDNYLPPGQLLNAAHGADDILDTLVDAWLGIARELLSRGDRVTLLAAAQDRPGEPFRPEAMPCRTGQAPRWQDLGARVRWQGSYDLPKLMEEHCDGLHGVVVTARFTAPPPQPLADQSMTWLFLDPADALGPPEKHWSLQVTRGGRLFNVLDWIARLPNPVGSDENATHRRFYDIWRVMERNQARHHLRLRAQSRANAVLSRLKARGDALYRVERPTGAIRIVGLQGRQNTQKVA